MLTIIQCVNMAKEKSRYKYGEYIIRPIKGRYYVYKLENINGETRERYVGPLVDVVETYLKLKENGDVGAPDPHMRPPGFEPGITGLGGQRPTRLDYGRNINLLV